MTSHHQHSSISSISQQSSTESDELNEPLGKSKFLDFFNFSKTKPTTGRLQRKPFSASDILSTSEHRNSFQTASLNDFGNEMQAISVLNNKIALTSSSTTMQSQAGSHRASRPVKRTSNNFLLNIIAPPYKTRANEFKKLFGSKVPPGELFITEFSCALNKDFLMQGRLYISKNHFCFYSNLLFIEKRLVCLLFYLFDVFFSFFWYRRTMEFFLNSNFPLVLYHTQAKKMLCWNSNNPSFHDVG